MNKLKKVLKFVGKLLSIVAIVYIIIKLSDMEFDYKSILNTRNLIISLGLIIVQISIIATSCFPWLKFVEILSGIKIKFIDSMLVYMKANLYKYIPGNVFQYVARNELAVNVSVSHFDVAMSTALDTGMSLIFALILSFVCLGTTVIDYLGQYNGTLKLVIIICVVLIGIVVTLIVSFQNKFKDYINKYKKCVSKDNLKRFIQILLYYLYNNIVNCFVFGVIIYSIMGCEIKPDELLNLMGAFIFSLIIGMITPGASGGIGIRESVMMLITENRYDVSIIISSMILLRIISIIGDIGAFLFRSVLIMLNNTKKEKEGEI